MKSVQLINVATRSRLKRFILLACQGDGFFYEGGSVFRSHGFRPDVLDTLDAESLKMVVKTILSEIADNPLASEAYVSRCFRAGQSLTASGLSAFQGDWNLSLSEFNMGWSRLTSLYTHSCRATTVL